MNQIDELHAWIKIALFVGLGLFIGFALWHPTNNNYGLGLDYEGSIQSKRWC